MDNSNRSEVARELWDADLVNRGGICYFPLNLIFYLSLGSSGNRAEGCGKFSCKLLVNIIGRSTMVVDP